MHPLPEKMCFLIFVSVCIFQNLSGKSNSDKNGSNKRIQKQKINKEQVTLSLKSKWIIRKSLTKRGRRLISKNEFETGGHDSGSVAYFSGKAPFTSDYCKPMHHPPKNN
jgi:hypothetical protein